MIDDSTNAERSDDAQRRSEAPCSTAWSDVSPNAPGWAWYEDEDYGPAPVYLDWVGFRNRPDARTLEVDMCVGEDQELVGMHIGELHGRWYPLAEPPKQ